MVGVVRGRALTGSEVAVRARHPHLTSSSSSPPDMLRAPAHRRPRRLVHLTPPAGWADSDRIPRTRPLLLTLYKSFATIYRKVYYNGGRLWTHPIDAAGHSTAIRAADATPLHGSHRTAHCPDNAGLVRRQAGSLSQPVMLGSAARRRSGASPTPAVARSFQLTRLGKKQRRR